jgi:RsiW-degrading membrane proteinase PrsW (M82 family)
MDVSSCTKTCGAISSACWEPLDGILLGSASAVGFTLLETMGQHVPNIIQNVTLQAGPDAGQLVGLQLLIPRILGSAAGHMAYSGYLGYFIGLSALKPRKRTHFGRRLFQRFGTSRFVECVGSG